jgi:YVTN family beta-propeller protein
MRAVHIKRLVAILAVALMELGCGDTFRPIAVPENPNPPNPSSLHFELVLTANGPQVCSSGPTATCDPLAHPGGSSRIDVSGDSNVGTATVGLGPVHGLMLPPNNTQAFIANQLDGTISSYATSTAATVTTITLPSGSKPAFLATTQTDTIYAANPGNNTVSVISVTQNVVKQTIAVGNNPIAMAETPDGKKLYVVNQGDNSVSVINTIDDSINATLTVGTNPTWIVARADGAKMYVLNQGTVSSIDTATDTVAAPVAVGAANYMFYDDSLNRLYLTISSPSQLAVLNVAVDPPAALPSVDLSAGCPAGCLLDSVAALPNGSLNPTQNGSKVYVSSHQVSGTCTQLAGAPTDLPPCITTRVSIIQTPNNVVEQTLTTMHTVFVNSVSLGTKPDVPVVPFCDSTRFRRHIAAARDGSRVYVANCDAGGIDIIRTSDDTFVMDMVAPVSSAPAVPGQSFPPPQNPVFVLSEH